MSLSTTNMTKEAPPARRAYEYDAHQYAPLIPLKLALANAAPPAKLPSLHALALPAFSPFQAAAAWPGTTTTEKLALAPWTQQSAHAWAHDTLPRVDMQIVPAAEPAKDAVRVTFSSAEDLADALFPTAAADVGLHSRLEQHQSELADLNAHHELVSEALHDHKDEIRKLHSTMSLADEGLVDHKKHLRQLKTANKDTLNTLRAHEQQTEQLAARVRSLESGLRGTAKQPVLEQKVSALTDKIEVLQHQMSSVAQQTRCTSTEHAATSARVAQLAATAAEHGKGLAEHTKCLATCGTSVQSLHATHAATQNDIAALSKTLLANGMDPQQQELAAKLAGLQQEMAATQKKLAEISKPAARTAVHVAFGEGELRAPNSYHKRV